MDENDPLLDCVDQALDATRRDQDGEVAARACVELLRTEAERYRDPYLVFCLQMLTEALSAPPDERPDEVVAALAVCRRTILSGTP